MALTYHCAVAGSAGNSGLSPLLPKQTYAQCNALAVSGDTVKGNGGDTFPESVTSVAGVTYAAYGVGKPTISGTTVAASNSWTTEAISRENFTDGAGAKPDCWYLLTEVSGTRADGNITNNNTLSENGGTIPRATGPNANIPFAASFARASSQFLSRADGSLNAGFAGKSGVADVNVSFGCWIRPTYTTIANNPVGVMGKSGYGIYLFNGTVVADVLDDASTQHFVFGANILADTWTHVVVTWNQATGTITLYVNGVSSGTPATSATMLQSAAAFTVGSFSGNNYDGLIAEPFVLTGTVLSAAQISDIFTGGLAGASSTVYYRGSTPADPVTVIANNQLLVPVTLKTNLWPGRCWWDDPNDRIYVRLYEDANPANYQVEVGAQDRCFNNVNKASVTLQNTILRGGREANLFVQGTSSNFTAEGVLSELGLGMGFACLDAVNTIDTVRIRNSEFRYHGCGGIDIAVITSTGWVIENCRSHHNAQANAGYGIQIPAGILISWQNASGIKVFSYTQQGGIAVRDNVVDSNGVPDKQPSFNVQGAGIWIDTFGAATVTGNLIVGNRSSGIIIEKNIGSTIARNAVYQNGLEQIASFNYTQNFCGNICCIVGGGFNGSGNLFYHNTSYGGFWGLEHSTPDAQTSSNNIFRNNIFVGATVHALHATLGAANDGTHGTGNIYDHNCFGDPAANFVQYGAAQQSTYAALDTAYGSAMNNAQSNPLFVNAAAELFTLQPASPCRDTGVVIAGINDGTGGSPLYHFAAPDMGAFEITGSAGFMVALNASRLARRRAQIQRK